MSKDYSLQLNVINEFMLKTEFTKHVSNNEQSKCHSFYFNFHLPENMNSPLPRFVVGFVLPDSSFLCKCCVGHFISFSAFSFVYPSIYGFWYRQILLMLLSISILFNLCSLEHFIWVWLCSVPEGNLDHEHCNNSNNQLLVYLSHSCITITDILYGIGWICLWYLTLILTIF